MKGKWFFLACLLCVCASVQGRQPYSATVFVDAESASVSAPNIVDLSRDLKGPEIQALIPVYTPTSPAAIDINLRGIDALGSFAANSTTFVVFVQQTGQVVSFTGSTRDESLALFKDYVKEAGTHHNLLKAYARYSPVDPIAGNPNSLMAQMGQADYALGRLSPLSGCSSCWDAQPLVHQFQAGLWAERAFPGGYETTMVTLPLRYSYSPDLRWALIIDAPLTYNRNDGSSSVFGSLGIGLRLPILDFWSLTPIIRLGSGGSLDLCTAGNFAAAGATSEVHIKLSDYVLSMTNYASYYTSTNLWLTGINFNYHLHNWVYKNGVSITSCCGYEVLNRPLNLSVSFVDSCFTGDRLFINHYDEIGISLITTGVNPCLEYDCLSVGFTYKFGGHGFNAYAFNCTYQF